MYFINNRATSGVTKCASDGIKVAVTVSGGSGGGTGECVPVACRVDGPPTNTLTLDNRCCSIADGHGYKASCAAGFTYYQWGSASTNGEWKGETCASPSTGTCCVASSGGSPPVGATLPSSPAPWKTTTWTGELPAFSYAAGSKCAAGKSAEPISITKKAVRISATSSCISATGGSSPTLRNYKQTCVAGDSSFEQQSCDDSEDCTTCRGTKMTYSIEKVGGDAFCVTTPDMGGASSKIMSFMSSGATTASDASATMTDAFAPCLAGAFASDGSSALPLGLGLGLGIPAVAAAALMLRKRGAGAKPPASGAVEMGKSTAGVAADAASAL